MLCQFHPHPSACERITICLGGNPKTVLCTHVLMWLCAHVFMWLCTYVLMWSCDYVDTDAVTLSLCRPRKVN